MPVPVLLHHLSSLRSNIFLTVVDIPRYAPDMPANWPITHKMCQVGFILSFIVLRLILWPIITVPVVWELLIMIRDSTCHSEIVVCLFLFCALILTYLQFMWGIKIVRMGWTEVNNLIGSGASKRSDAEKKD